MTTVLVTGGTGALGTSSSRGWWRAGHDVACCRVASVRSCRRACTAVRGDLTTGAGLEEATSGVDVIAHLASGSRRRCRPTRARSAPTSRHAAAARRREAQRLAARRLHLDRRHRHDPVRLLPREARDASASIEASGLPYTILRTTQWHTLAGEFCRHVHAAARRRSSPKGLRMQLLDAERGRRPDGDARRTARRRPRRRAWVARRRSSSPRSSAATCARRASAGRSCRVPLPGQAVRGVPRRTATSRPTTPTDGSPGTSTCYARVAAASHYLKTTTSTPPDRFVTFTPTSSDWW